MTTPTVRLVPPNRQLLLTVTGVNAPRQWRVWLELLKPVTWFPPMWAVACGVVASGATLASAWPRALLAMILAGPLVCGASQAVNDWFDREVDALNEPQRPIPSGRVPGKLGLWFAIGWSALALAVSALLGTLGVFAIALALILAWAYSAPPARLKRNGWWGNTAVGLSYEGLAWIVGTAVVAGHTAPSIAFAALYSLGTVGIMTLNDFKAIDGDRRMGIDSLPVLLGVDSAARVACATIAGTQLVVIAVLLARHAPIAAAIVAILVGIQLQLMRRFLRDPKAHALWFSASGVPFFVLGMMVCAVALRASHGVI
jgi:chlorophyll/bacteriochlorophyll a synthase